VNVNNTPIFKPRASGSWEDTLSRRVELGEVFNQKDFVFLMPYYTLVKGGASAATFGEFAEQV